VGGRSDGKPEVVVPLNESNPTPGHLDPPHSPWGSTAAFRSCFRRERGPLAGGYSRGPLEREATHGQTTRRAVALTLLFVPGSWWYDVEMKGSAKKSAETSRVRAPQRAILAKMLDLPPEKVAEVEDFVDFLHQRQEDRRLTQAASKMSKKALAKVWSNSADAAYDRP
jgi:hypothetical protein